MDFARMCKIMQRAQTECKWCARIELFSGARLKRWVRLSRCRTLNGSEWRVIISGRQTRRRCVIKLGLKARPSLAAAEEFEKYLAARFKTFDDNFSSS